MSILLTLFFDARSVWFMNRFCNIQGIALALMVFNYTAYVYFSLELVSTLFSLNLKHSSCYINRKWV